MYIDVHTHSSAPSGRPVIQNCLDHFEAADSGGWYSLGVHPGYIDGDGERQLGELERYLSRPRVLAIGECGLDKGSNAPFSTQQQVFLRQVAMARVSQKPLIIHCVKSWEEIFALLSISGLAVPVIFHGYRKSVQMARRIVEQGYYLSFGKALAGPQVQQILREVPADRFFLETDNSHQPIETLYALAARALGIDLNSLSLQVQQNAARVFGTRFINHDH